MAAIPKASLLCAVSGAEDNLLAPQRQPLLRINTTLPSTTNSASLLTMLPIPRKRRASASSDDLTRAFPDNHAIDPQLLKVAATITAGTEAVPVPKRQRLHQPPSLPTPPATPATPAGRPSQTMRLKLIIPQPELNQKEEIKLKRREKCAQAWKPKLQRPYPSKKELKDSYSLKLLRYYPRPLTPTESNFIKPPIDRSPRVDHLRRAFPIPSPLSATTNYTTPYSVEASHNTPSSEEQEKQEFQLKVNKEITKTDEVQRLAWQNFSTKEEDRRDNGRDAMMHSALWEEDLEQESKGLPNHLPTWRKTFTSRFALE